MAVKFVGTFILTDDSLDRDGERVIPSGVKLQDFQNNPVMFYNHHRSSRWNDGDSMKITPIGRWDNVRLEDGKILGDAMIDQEDEFAKSIGDKVENGILNAVSIGFRPLVFSDDEEDKLPGQRGFTFVESELLEASIVDIPSNRNALEVSISAKISEKGLKKGDDISKIKELKFKTCYKQADKKEAEDSNTKNFKMKNFTKFLTWCNDNLGTKFSVDSTEEEISEAMKALPNIKGMETEVETLKGEIAEMKSQIEKSAPQEGNKNAEEIEALKKSISEVQELVKGANTSIIDLKAVNDKLTAEKSELEKSMADLKLAKGNNNSEGPKEESTKEKFNNTLSWEIPTK